MTAVDDAFPRDLAARPRADSRASQVLAALITAREFTSDSRPTPRHTVGSRLPGHQSAAPTTTHAAGVARVTGRDT
ncbi:hypothetical protein [Streptomyces sp. NPDC005322]|uniref:hypothetical protein n=1 Tax=Streptomyces sp. NPDC005322 TaxID=3157032 RepID=UPI0033A6A688